MVQEDKSSATGTFTDAGEFIPTPPEVKTEAEAQPTPEAAVEAKTPPAEATYTATQVEEMRRGFQAQKDREVATERQKVQQAAYQDQVIDQAQSYLLRISEEDPDEFTAILKLPEVASFWGEIAGAKVNEAREEIAQQVRGESEAAALTQLVASTVRGLARLPEFKEWTVEKFRQEKLYPADFGNDFEAWVAALVDRVSETRTQGRASKAAETIAEARVRERLGLQNENAADQVPPGGASGGSLTAAAYKERLERGEVVRPEDIDAMTSRYMRAAT